MDYKGYLICTDMDGTFSITDENIKAIKEFQEGGGLFTLATGRNISYIEEVFSALEIKPNAPAVMCNGAVLYDYANRKILQENFINYKDYEMFLEVAEKFDVPLRLAQFGETKELENIMVPHEGINPDKIYKAVWHTKDKLETLKEYVTDKFGKDFELTQSCSSMLEVNKKGISKSSGTLFVKEYTKSHTLICVGDYGNDIPMLKTADISYAVENAREDVKKAAMRVTVSNKDSAIARIIKDIGGEKC